MQLRHLKTFMAVASTLNITRAAEQVHLAQSSVTEQIQALEADLGTLLFDRSRRRLQLTAAGRRLLDYAGDLLALADEVRNTVADETKGVAGKVAVGGLETICARVIPALVAKFQLRYPDVNISLRSANSGELRGAIRSGAMDVCFVFGAAAPEPKIQSEQVAQEALVIIVPPQHRLASRETIEPGDLAGEPFLVTEPGCVYRKLFDEAFPEDGPQSPRLVGEFTSVAAICSLVEAGVGCALIPRLVATDAASAGRIVVLPWVGRCQSVPVTMMWRQRRKQPPAIRLLLDMARGGLGDVIPASAHHPHGAPPR